VPNMIGSFTSGAPVFLVVKNGTKKLSQAFHDGFWCVRCVNNPIEVPDMIGSFPSVATISLVAKHRTKDFDVQDI